MINLEVSRLLGCAAVFSQISECNIPFSLLYSNQSFSASPELNLNNFEADLISNQRSFGTKRVAVKLKIMLSLRSTYCLSTVHMPFN